MIEADPEDDGEETTEVEAGVVGRRRGRPTRSNGALTRRKLLKVATAMFSAGGYEATSLRQIASAASVDLATLKYHFGDKPALYGEVYRVGHQAFFDAIAPALAGMATIETREALREQIALLSRVVHDFIDQYLPFVRMVLYRLLEGASEANEVEDELQVGAIGLIDATFEGLKERGIVRGIDSRAFVSLLVTGFAMWFVTARVKPHWLGEPQVWTLEGRRRSEEFFKSVMERMLLA